MSTDVFGMSMTTMTGLTKGLDEVRDALAVVNEGLVVANDGMGSTQREVGYHTLTGWVPHTDGLGTTH